MDDDQQNSEIEKIANLMIHDGISPDEQNVTKLEKYKNIIKEDCFLLESAELAQRENKIEKIIFSDEEFSNFLSGLLSDL